MEAKSGDTAADIAQQLTKARGHGGVQKVFQELLDRYRTDPVLRTLVETTAAVASAMFPPFGAVVGVFDAGLTSTLEKMYGRRLHKFFDELASGTIPLTEETINNEDFLHAYFATLRAATNTRHDQKIQLFARLFSGAIRVDRVGEVAFEEFLSILDDLSVRELNILQLLHRFEEAHPHQKTETGDMENDLQRASRLWPALETSVEQELRVGSQDLAPMLTRLNRTGFYETFTGGFLDYGGGRGHLTSFFYRFAEWVRAGGGTDERLNRQGVEKTTAP